MISLDDCVEGERRSLAHYLVNIEEEILQYAAEQMNMDGSGRKRRIQGRKCASEMRPIIGHVVTWTI